jgi:hypothetical protein
VAAFEPGPLIERLVDAGVGFVIVGGFAEIARGYVRATKDLDIVPAPTRGKYERAYFRGRDVRVCSIAELVRMKRRAGRPQDVADLAALEAAHGPMASAPDSDSKG